MPHDTPEAKADFMETTDEDLYPCVGICMADPDSGYCLGCGRPPLGDPGIVAEVVATSPSPVTGSGDPDSPS